MSARDRNRARGRGLRRRGVAGTPRRPVFHLFVEGSVTEPEYFDRLRDIANIAGGIATKVNDSENTPRPIVEAALEARKASSDSDIHQFWAVFDVESPIPHGDLDEAIDLAERYDIPTAVSNPCFELWLLLHATDQNGHLDSGQAEARRRAMDGSTSKHLTGRTPVNAEGVSRACERSARLRDRHAKDGTEFPRDNPSSSMDRLIEAMRTVSTAR